ncbi:hypothetical protein KBB68_03250 [Candidatus Babeliales bacterium]|nr:hypothetical protein [Candidatus Babeliales bacterium]
MKKIMIFLSVVGCGNLIASTYDPSREALLAGNYFSLEKRYQNIKRNSVARRAREKCPHRGDYLINDPRPLPVLDEDLLNNNTPLYPTK